VKIALVCLAAIGGVLLLANDGRKHRGDAASVAPGSVGVPASTHVTPSAPAPYRVPAGAIRVDSSRGLRAALAARRRSSIVLAPGVYRGTRPFLNPYGHQLYAARLGKAVLRAGLSMGGNGGRGGGLVRGLAFDVGDRRRTVDGAAIAVWGTGRRTQILDTAIQGRATLPAGISARQPDGLRIRRLVAQIGRAHV